MDKFCIDGLDFFNKEFKRQTKWLHEQGLTIKDLDNMDQEEYKSINNKWRKYDQHLKSRNKN